MTYPNPPFINRMYSVFRMVRWFMTHPLTRSRKAEAVTRYIAWQIGSRMLPGPVAVPFVDSTRLLVSPSMTEATYNMYFGLAEFEDMGLVLHVLRPDDLFVDIGANIGSYTVIASGAVGARSFAVEPVPSTFARLLDNVRLNNIDSRVSAKNVAVGSACRFVSFTTSQDCMNHVLFDGEQSVSSIRVPVTTVDDLLCRSPATLIKIDVEGFEAEVIEGASATLRSASLLAIIMELNGSGLRYGFDDAKLHKYMLDLNFQRVEYDPLRRQLIPLETTPSGHGNAVYVRDIERVRERVESAPRYHVRGALL